MDRPRPNYLWSLLTMRCPRCRRGSMFNTPGAYQKISLKNIFSMHEVCPECGQRFDLEPGFWYGTAYVSYALTVALSVVSFIGWWAIVGISVNDNRLYYWLAVNGLLLIVLQPWIMRLSRSVYIRFFVKYDPHYDESKPTEFS